MIIGVITIQMILYSQNPKDFTKEFIETTDIVKWQVTKLALRSL